MTWARRNSRFAPARFHEVVDLGGSLKNDPLHALLPAEFFNIDAGQFGHIRFAVDHRREVGDGGRIVGIEGEGLDL